MKPSRPTNEQGNSPASRPERRERVQKIMATSGVGSRRAIEKQIALGNIRLNRAKAEPGAAAAAGDILQMQQLRVQNL